MAILSCTPVLKASQDLVVSKDPFRYTVDLMASGMEPIHVKVGYILRNNLQILKLSL